ncbi:Ubiquitin-protein ligase E3A [Tritrichomonas musculus]|uniref:HECT-type E3 ubiquitin transferase n=1 Tax=Tritrichomonas musculus TaxID=1915356 RepID=A0ABR2GMZ3_9EUKA
MLIGHSNPFKKVIILNGRATKISISHSLADSENFKLDECLPSLYPQPNDIELLEKISTFDIWAKNFVDSLRIQADQLNMSDPTTDEQFLSQIENLINIEFFSLCMKSNSNPFSQENSAIDDYFLFNFFLYASQHPQFQSISQKIIISSTRYLLSSSRRNLTYKKLRLICLLLYVPALYQNADQLNNVIKIVGTFSKSIRSVFSTWLSSLPHLLSRIVAGCQFLLNTFYDNFPLATSIDTSQIFIFETLDLCYESNHLCHYKLPQSAFYNKNIDDRASGKLLLPFPFVLSFQSRLKLCRNQTRELQVSAEVDHMLRGCDGRLDVYLRRSSYFSDFQKHFLKAKPSSFYRRLKVYFVDEIAVDAGGPQKECLRMVTENLKEKTLRIVNKRLLWFKRCPKENPEQPAECSKEAANESDNNGENNGCGEKEIRYLTKEQQKAYHSKQKLKELINNPMSNYKLLGIVVGLAIANEIILPIRFPRFLYSHLLKTQKKPTMNDFMEIDPVAASSLQSMIDMKNKGGDVSQLDMTFEITNDEGETIDLNDINTENLNRNLCLNNQCSSYFGSPVDINKKRKRTWTGASAADGSPTIYSIAMATAIQKVSPLQKAYRTRRSSAAASLILKGQLSNNKYRNSSSFTTSSIHHKPVNLKIASSSPMPVQGSPQISSSNSQLIDTDDIEGPNIFSKYISTPNRPFMVTNDNVELFVLKYIDYEINHRYSKELESFRSGFELACPTPYISMLTAEEMDLVISGAEEFDWGALVTAAKYKDGLDKASEEVRWFWEVFWEFSEDERLEFLKFTTGSDRAPFGGLGKVRITFRKGGRHEMLPVAHTCFNMFFLPKYKSKEELRSKLLLAFKYSEGFGIE